MRLSILILSAICSFGYVMSSFGHGIKTPEFYLAGAFMIIFIALGYAKGRISGYREGLTFNILSQRGSRSRV